MVRKSSNEFPSFLKRFNEPALYFVGLLFFMEEFIHGFNILAGGYIPLLKIWRFFHGNFQRAWEKGTYSNFLASGLSQSMAQQIVKEREKLNIRLEFSKVLEQNVACIGRGSKEFPPLLKETADPPFLLYRRGAELNSRTRYIAMVGTRVPSLYGEKIAYQIAEAIAAGGAVIVSGLAFGIDAFCHFSAVKQRKPTVAILASGVTTITPRGHYALGRKILETGGSIISEYPPCHSSFKGNFLERNRIISGMADTTIVIEAKDKSGALITARHAFDQNRTIYALIGDINRSQSQGCLQLIQKEMASPIFSVSQLLRELGFHPKRDRLSALPSEEKYLADMINERTLSTEELVYKSYFPMEKIHILLSRLELKNYIRKNREGKWEMFSPLIS